jgi:hypothetical protein
VAHELAHTVQQGAGERLARACADELAAMSVPAGDSTLTGHAFVNLSTVPITSDIAVSPLAGNFHVLFHVPGELQRLISPGFLAGMTITADISATIGSGGATGPAAQFSSNELCVFVTFHRGAEATASQEWFADLRILRGSRFVAPLRMGIGTPTGVAVPPSLAAGVARVNLELTDELTASAGPFAIGSLGDLTATWAGIRDQVRDTLAVRIANIQVPLDLRTRASLTVPVPLGGAAEEPSSVLPVNVLGDIHLSTQLSTEEERGFRLRLSGTGTGMAVAGLVNLELSGSGRLSGPLPASVRLGDLSADFVRELLGSSEGGGEITGRLTAFGLPGRLGADFRIRGGRLTGDATFLSPLGVGGGTFGYHLDEGLSATLGMVGLTHLVIAPSEERLDAVSRTRSGPAAYDFGTSVTGFGVTGVRLTPETQQILSIGVGPQLITTPRGETETGVYGGLWYQLTF